MLVCVRYEAVSGPRLLLALHLPFQRLRRCEKTDMVGTLIAMTASPAALTRRLAAATQARDSRAMRSKRMLHKALLSLVACTPLDQIRVDDIVEQAKVGRSTFYRHFATKEDLIESIASEEIDNLFNASQPLFWREDSFASSLALAAYVDANRSLWRILIDSGASGSMRECFIRRSIALESTSGHDPDIDLPIDLAAACGVAVVFEAISWWLRQDRPSPVAQVAAYVERLAVRPFLPEK